MEVEQWGLEPLPKWDAGIMGGNFKPFRLLYYFFFLAFSKRSIDEFFEQVKEPISKKYFQC